MDKMRKIGKILFWAIKEYFVALLGSFVLISVVSAGAYLGWLVSTAAMTKCEEIYPPLAHAVFFFVSMIMVTATSAIILYGIMKAVDFGVKRRQKMELKKAN